MHTMVSLGQSRPMFGGQSKYSDITYDCTDQSDHMCCTTCAAMPYLKHELQLRISRHLAQFLGDLDGHGDVMIEVQIDNSVCA